MLCTMCMHGINVTAGWVCPCLKLYCRHIDQCPTCQTRRADLPPQAGNDPRGNPEDIQRWRAARVQIPATGSKKRPKKKPEGGFPEDGGQGGGPTWTPPFPGVEKKKVPTKDIFNQRRQEDPQGVIDDLLAQTTRQARAIHDLNKQIEELKRGKEATP